MADKTDPEDFSQSLAEDHVNGSDNEEEQDDNGPRLAPDRTHPIPVQSIPTDCQETQEQEPKIRVALKTEGQCMTRYSGNEEDESAPTTDPSSGYKVEDEGVAETKARWGRRNSRKDRAGGLVGDSPLSVTLETSESGEGIIQAKHHWERRNPRNWGGAVQKQPHIQSIPEGLTNMPAVMEDIDGTDVENPPNLHEMTPGGGPGAYLEFSSLSSTVNMTVQQGVTAQDGVLVPNAVVVTMATATLDDIIEAEPSGMVHYAGRKQFSLMHELFRNRRRRCLLAIGIVIICAAIIGGLAGSGAFRRKSEDPAPALQAFLQPHLSAESFAALSEPSSPQYKSLQWMLLDSNLDIYEDWRKIQRFVLATLYYATGGGSIWSDSSGWLDDADECTWSMSASEQLCDDEGQLTSLMTADNRLSGILPFDEVTLLTNLEVLFFAVNTDLDGSIPNEIARLTNLAVLELSETGFSGPIPSAVGSLTNLNLLGLRLGGFSGRIPTELGRLDNLKELTLSSTDLVGPIPTEFGRMRNLEKLNVSDTNVAGHIPTEIGMLVNLQYLSLENTNVIGSIPKELGSLVHLEALHVGNTDLLGWVPEVLCNLRRDHELSTFVADCNEVTCSCCTNCDPPKWNMIGKPLMGGDDYHYFGLSVDIVPNGTVVAIGAMADNMGEGDELSYAEVYRLNEVENSWELVGDRILGPRGSGAGRQDADSIFLSEDGDRLLIYSSSYNNTGGLVQIFDLDGTTWALKNARIGSNTTTKSEFAVEKIRTVRMSNSGKYVAMALSASSGDAVQVYGFSSDSSFYWHGSTHFGEDTDSSFGRAVAISSSGTTLVVGGEGFAMVYRFGGSDWIRPATRLTGGTFSTAGFGGSVAVSDDGTTVAVGDSYSYSDAGSITVYRYNTREEAWEQLGGVVHGNFNAGQMFKDTVLLSEDGAILAVKAVYGTSDPSALLRVFKYNGEDWGEMDSVEGDTSPMECALSADGMTVCCGEQHFSDGDDIGRGRAYIYRLGLPLPTLSAGSIEGTTTDNGDGSWQASFRVTETNGEQGVEVEVSVRDPSRDVFILESCLTDVTGSCTIDPVQLGSAALFAGVYVNQMRKSGYRVITDPNWENMALTHVTNPNENFLTPGKVEIQTTLQANAAWTVTVTIHEYSGRANVNVAASFGDGPASKSAYGDASCTTDASGSCTTTNAFASDLESAIYYILTMTPSDGDELVLPDDPGGEDRYGIVANFVVPKPGA